MADQDDDRLRERVDQLEDVTKQQNETIRKLLPDRRDALKIGGSAIAGGLAVGGLTGSASGQTSSAGQVGTPEEPNDMFAWDLDVANQVVTDLDMAGNAIANAGSLSTGATTINGGQPQGFQDGRIVIQSPGSGLNDSIAPADYTNPLNEAITQAPTDSVIYLPPEGVSQPDDVIYNTPGVAIRGPGNTRSPDETANCVVEITNPTNAGLLVQANMSRVEWGGFALKGPGDGASTPPAINVDGAGGGQINSCEIHPLIVRQWGGPVLDAGGSSDKEFANVWHQIVAFNVDAGGSSAMMKHGASPPSVFTSVQLYPSATHSGSNSTSIRNNNGSAIYDYLGVGNATGQVLNSDGDNSEFVIRHCRYEATSQQSAPFSLFSLNDKGMDRIESVALNEGATTEVVFISGTAPMNKYIGPMHSRTGGITVSGDYVRVNADTGDVSGSGDAPIQTALTSGQVNNSTGATLTQPVAALGDLSLVS